MPKPKNLPNIYTKHRAKINKEVFHLYEFRVSNNNLRNNIPSEISNSVSNTNEISHNNVVFRVLKTESPDIYNLYSLDGNELSKNSIALIPTLRISQKMYHLFKDSTILNINMECKFSKIFERWIPEKVVSCKPYSMNQINNITKILIE